MNKQRTQYARKNILQIKFMSFCFTLIEHFIYVHFKL